MNLKSLHCDEFVNGRVKKVFWDNGRICYKMAVRIADIAGGSYVIYRDILQEIICNM